ncbi:MAG: Arsenate-mycothiol transferase ArsC2 [Candidatus Heimdallarchaeota archaeon LC_3]|nr:MAG: Arsenate-mycothiol transferase ArsC2 [Candidatus Heimdallarchaeota archaeon LC_3]
MNKQQILFLCSHNSARSIMAEALTNHFLSDKFEAQSAGIEKTQVRSKTKIVLEELGINSSKLYSKHLNDFVQKEIDHVVTVCDFANEFCPTFPKAKNFHHWSFPDPSKFEGTDEEVENYYRKIRDEIKDKILSFGKNF